MAPSSGREKPCRRHRPWGSDASTYLLRPALLLGPSQSSDTRLAMPPLLRILVKSKACKVRSEQGRAMKGTWTDHPPRTCQNSNPLKLGGTPGGKGCVGLSPSQRLGDARCSGCFLAVWKRRNLWECAAGAQVGAQCGRCRVRHSPLCASQLPCLLPAASGAGHDGGQPLF